MIEGLSDAPVTANNIATWMRRYPVMSEVLDYILCQVKEEIKPYWSKKFELSAEAGCIIWSGRVAIPPRARDTVLIYTVDIQEPQG